MSSFLNQAHMGADIFQSSTSQAPGQVEPVKRVMDVLAVLLAETTSPQIRAKANQWLTQFQRAQETSPLVVDILTAALCPEQIQQHQTLQRQTLQPPTSPKALGGAISPHTIQAIGEAQPAAQQQLLFFLAQTLNSKLRRAITRPVKLPASSAGVRSDAEFSWCSPKHFLLMARRAVHLPSGSHPSLARNLALAVGQLCILWMERADEAQVEEVNDIMRLCFSAISSDGDKCKRAIPSGSADLGQFAHSVDELKGLPSSDGRFAVEIFSSVCASARLIVSTRGVSESVSRAVRQLLVQIMRATLTVQSQSVNEAVQQLCGMMAKVTVAEATNNPDLPVAICTCLQRVLEHFTELSELGKEAADSFLEFSKRYPLESDIEYIKQVAEPLFDSSVALLATMMAMMDGKGLTVLGALLPVALVRDFTDALRQSTITTVEQTNSVLKRATHLMEQLSAKKIVQRRRASISGVTVEPPAEDRTATVRDACSACSTGFTFATWISRVCANCQIDQRLRNTTSRLQLARSLRLLFESVTPEGFARDDWNKEVNLRQNIRELGSWFEQEHTRRRQEAAQTAGSFWQQGSGWNPVPRQPDAVNSEGEPVDTPAELMPRQREKQTDDGGESAAEMEDEDNLDALWAQQPLSPSLLLHRVCLLEEMWGGFCLGQLARLMGHTGKALAPVIATVALFATPILHTQQSISLAAMGRQTSRGPRGTPLQQPVLPIATWMHAVSVDPYLGVRDVVNELGSQTGSLTDLDARAPLQILELLADIVMLPRPFLLPVPQDPEQIVAKYFVPQVGGGNWLKSALISPGLMDGIAQTESLALDVGMPFCLGGRVVAGRAALVEDARGLDSALTGFHAVLNWMETLTPAADQIRAELRAPYDYMNELAAWGAECSCICCQFPLNFERLSFGLKGESLSLRKQYRMIAKTLFKLPLQRVKEQITSVLFARFCDLNMWDPSAHKGGEDLVADLLAEILTTQKWKSTDALITGLTCLGSECPPNVLANLDALGHRGLLRGALWVLIGLKFNPEIADGAFRLCRAALRLPQSDPAYPMALNEDHLGAVAIEQLARAAEDALPQAAVFYQGLVNGGFLGQLAEDITWLIEELTARSLRLNHPPSSLRAPVSSGHRCYASLASLCLLTGALGQLTSGALQTGALDWDAATGLHRGVVGRLVQICCGVLKETQTQLSCEAANAIVQAACCYLCTVFSPFFRPSCGTLQRLGIPIKPGSWAAATTDIMDKIFFVPPRKSAAMPFPPTPSSISAPTPMPSGGTVAPFLDGPESPGGTQPIAPQPDEASIRTSGLVVELGSELLRRVGEALMPHLGNQHLDPLSRSLGDLSALIFSCPGICLVEPVPSQEGQPFETPLTQTLTETFRMSERDPAIFGTVTVGIRWLMVGSLAVNAPESLVVKQAEFVLGSSAAVIDQLISNVEAVSSQSLGAARLADVYCGNQLCALTVRANRSLVDIGSAVTAALVSFGSTAYCQLKDQVHTQHPMGTLAFIKTLCINDSLRPLLLTAFKPSSESPLFVFKAFLMEAAQEKGAKSQKATPAVEVPSLPVERIPVVSWLLAATMLLVAALVGTSGKLFREIQDAGYDLVMSVPIHQLLPVWTAARAVLLHTNVKPPVRWAGSEHGLQAFVKEVEEQIAEVYAASHMPGSPTLPVETVGGRRRVSAATGPSSATAQTVKKVMCRHAAISRNR